MRLTQNTVLVRILLFVAVLVMLNLLVNRNYFRLDFTADKRYTLTKNTKEIAKNLSQPVTVTAYVSGNLPPQLKRVANDFKDLLVEYQSASNKNVVYEFIDPKDDDEIKQQAIQSQVFPQSIRSREKDKFEEQESFFGAVIKMGTRQAPIPALVDQRGEPLNFEYILTSNILRLDTTQKNTIGILTGHGETGLSRLQQALQPLLIQHNVDTVRFSSDPNAFNKYRTLVSLGAKTAFSQDELDKLDAFLESGGRLFIGLDAVDGTLSERRAWDSGKTGLEEWLNDKGIMVEQTFLIDQQSIDITIQTVIGYYGQQPLYGPANVPFCFIPRVRNFYEHPITEGLEEVYFQFPSPISILANPEKEINISPLVGSSMRSGTLSPPQTFNPEREWTQGDFPLGSQTIGVAMEGKLVGETESRMVVFSDGDFAQGDRQQPTIPDNVNLFVNSIDWLEDNTALVEVRTKEIESRPIEKFIGEEEATSRNIFKWINFLLPILIVIGFGLFRRQRSRNQRKQWEVQDYTINESQKKS
ncbi:MAG: Gldg family protein [Bacteroidia bacterium]|nr:Gldg family protein [Bacteroidia bacterium]